MSGETNARGALLVTLFALFAAIAFGFIAFLTIGRAEGQVGFAWYLFSYAAGITMIVLPCTLPLAFVIVPLSMGKGPLKGLLIALSFGFGVAFTLSLYGVVAAIVGQVAIGAIGAPLETVKNWLYFIAGIFAYLFALGSLGLISFTMPSYTGAFPAFIQKQQDYLKALLLGLFLGNIGIGCPHPATPFILGRIAVSGDIFYGWLLFFVHAIGRIIPLLFLAVIGILGVNALQALVARKDKIERATGWGMVFVAGFILVLGLFSHDWWVLSGIHTYLEELTQEEAWLNAIARQIGGTVAHTHGLPPADHTGIFGLPLAWGTWVLLTLWIAPLFWYYGKKKRVIEAMTDSEEKRTAQRTLPYLWWNMVTLALILILTFGYVLPNRFLAQAQMHDDEMMEDGHGGHAETHYHNELDVLQGPLVSLSSDPAEPAAGTSTRLYFATVIAPGCPLKGPNACPATPSGIPARDLQIQHEKLMHVIGARNDLREFFHIHPAPESPTSSLFTVSHAFVKPGEYRIWSEIKYAGEGHVFAHPPLAVSGEGPVSEPDREITVNKIVGRYQVGIIYDRLRLGADNHVDFTVKDAEGRTTPLDLYLGERMHLTIISDDLTQFIHTHPDAGDHMIMDDNHHALISRALAHGNGEPAGMTPGSEEHVGFTVPFVKPGFYKAFAQFRPSAAGLGPDDAHTAEFWIEVSAEAAGPFAVALGWWPKLFISLAFIALLGWIIKRYITVA